MSLIKRTFVGSAVFLALAVFGIAPQHALAAPTCTLTATRSSYSSGAAPVEFIRFDWTTTDAASFSINNGVGIVTPVSAGHWIVYNNLANTYVGTATAADGTMATCSSEASVRTPVPTSEVPGSAASSTACVPAGITHYLFFGNSDADTGGDVSKLQLFLKSVGLLDQSAPLGYYGPMTQVAVQQFQVQHNIVSSGTPDTTGYGAVGPATLAAINNACSGGTNSGGGGTTAPSGPCDPTGQPFSCVSGTVVNRGATGSSLFWGCLSTGTTTQCSVPNPLGGDQQACVAPHLTRTLKPGDTDAQTGGQVSALQQFLQSQGYLSVSAPLGTYDTATVQAVQQYQTKEKIVSSGSPLTTGYGAVGPRTMRIMNRECDQQQERVDSLRQFVGTGATTTDPVVKFLVNGSLVVTAHNTSSSGNIHILQDTTPILGWDISGMPSGAVCTRSSTTVSPYSNWPDYIKLLFGASTGSVVKGLRILPDMSTNSANFTIQCKKSTTNSTVLAAATVTVTYVGSESEVTPLSIPQTPLPPVADGSDRNPHYRIDILRVTPSLGVAGTKARVYATNISYFQNQPGGLYVNLGKKNTTVDPTTGATTTTVTWSSVASTFGVGFLAGDQPQVSEYLEFTVPSITFSTIFAGDDTLKVELGPKDHANAPGSQSAQSNAGFTVTDVNPFSSVTVVSPNGGEKYQAGSGKTILVTYTDKFIVPSQPYTLAAHLQQPQIRGFLVRPDGTELPVNWNASPVSSSSPLLGGGGSALRGLPSGTTNGAGTLELKLFRALTSPYAYGPDAGQYKVKVCVPNFSVGNYLGIGGEKGDVCDLSDNSFTIVASTTPL